MMYPIRWDMRLTDREILKAIHRLQKPASQREIAEHLDCSEKTVNRSIKRLKDKNILSMSMTGGRSVAATYQINHENVPDSIRQELS